jgi:hypothetical protein
MIPVTAEQKVEMLPLLGQGINKHEIPARLGVTPGQVGRSARLKQSPREEIDLTTLKTMKSSTMRSKQPSALNVTCKEH